MKIYWLLVLAGLVVGLGLWFLVNPPSTPPASVPFSNDPNLPLNIPEKKIIPGRYHAFQTFNNCGPASLAMALSYFDVNVTQQQLGQALRPYQVKEEMGAKAEEYGFTVYFRPAGTIEMLKTFIAYDIPVIARTWTKPDEDIGHFRLVRGYDDDLQQILQDDSLQNKNLWFSYDEFNSMWDKFGFEYLVLVPNDKLDIARKILGEDLDEQVAWQKSAANTTGLNRSVALYHLGDYSGSVREFEAVENFLPARALWYQLEPIQAYYQLANYDRVFSITDQIIENGNRANSELYLIRGQIYENQGNTSAARTEYQKAVFYNVNLEEAKTALSRVS
jgi:tetratricopeptide (TPR) repeat protein